MQRTIKSIRWVLAVWIGIVLLALVGCAPINQWIAKNGDGGAPYKFKNKAVAPNPVYYDFKDVLIPGELRESRQFGSVIYTSGVATGFNNFYGRVDVTSLTVFFNINMSKDLWTPVTLFKSSDMSIMLFHKKDRWCVINMVDRWFTTEVKIGVAPVLNDVMPDS